MADTDEFQVSCCRRAGQIALSWRCLLSDQLERKLPDFDRDRRAGQPMAERIAAGSAYPQR
jgi:hypothetical protein